jgi:hypothetical protein
MSVLPEGERLRRALRWISDRRLEKPDAPAVRLIDEAALRFDLTPVECEFLLELNRKSRESQS